MAWICRVDAWEPIWRREAERAVQLGQWLQIEPRVVHVGKSTGVVDALITADGEVVARADGTFQIAT
jgi:acyl-coenzyme A thioesterase PaaI-like protein